MMYSNKKKLTFQPTESLTFRSYNLLKEAQEKYGVKNVWTFLMLPYCLNIMTKIRVENKSASITRKTVQDFTVIYLIFFNFF